MKTKAALLRELSKLAKADTSAIVMGQWMADNADALAAALGGKPDAEPANDGGNPDTGNASG